MSGKKFVVENTSRAVDLAVSAGIADTAWSNFKGLMGAPSLPDGGGLVIKPCRSVHTHFMRFPIDVVYVSRENTVVGVDRRLKPWRIGTIFPRAHYVIELPAGAAAACRPGDAINVRPSVP